MTEPKCPLCQGGLVREPNVLVQHPAIYFVLAWVCTDCSAAFPIAADMKAFGGMAQPLYEDGKRHGTPSP